MAMVGTAIGRVHAIWIDHDKGLLIRASDRRKDGMALGFSSIVVSEALTASAY